MFCFREHNQPGVTGPTGRYHSTDNSQPPACSCRPQARAHTPQVLGKCLQNKQTNEHSKISTVFPQTAPLISVMKDNMVPSLCFPKVSLT